MWGNSLRKGRGLGGWGKEGRLGREGKESFPFPFRAFFSLPPLPSLICACQQASGERAAVRKQEPITLTEVLTINPKV